MAAKSCRLDSDISSLSASRVKPQNGLLPLVGSVECTTTTQDNSYPKRKEFDLLPTRSSKTRNMDAFEVLSCLEHGRD